MLKFSPILFLIIPFKLFAVADIPGQQPNLAIDTKGVIRMVYGKEESIFCITSADNGRTFSKAVLVAHLPGMHLGHSRGPQIASSKNFSLIAAIDKAGKIHSYRLNHSDKRWEKVGPVNDKSGSATEGLMAVTADKEDNFFAAWPDVRTGKNNICFSSIKGKSPAWTSNKLIYKSPDGHVCECCRPTIAINNNKLVVGFRNWLMGSRDIYYAVSNNKGKTFNAAKKSGIGTWRLNACPMDGGGLNVSESGKISAAWRRNGEVYYWSENQPELKVGEGRDINLAEGKGITLVTWQERNRIVIFNVKTKETSQIGNGISPLVYVLNNGKAICIWEDNKVVKYKVI